MSLKRTHSSLESIFLPELPRLSGDTLLMVFTHPSLRPFETQPDVDFDNARLAVLGQNFLRLLLSVALLDHRPALKASEIEARRESFLSGDAIPALVRHYGLLKHLRCHPDKVPAFNLPEEACSLFYAYIGGVFIDYGDSEPLREVVQAWLGTLGSDPYQPIAKRIKTEQTGTPSEFAAPSPSVKLPPTIEASRIPNPLTPAQPNTPFLMSFNEAAAKRGVTVDYPTEGREGQWVAQCLVGGIMKGSASGSTKKIAKELAARSALNILGWV